MNRSKFFIIIFSLFFLFSYSFIYAATIIEETFESCSDGNLAGCNGWTGGNVQVGSSVVYQGTKAAFVTNGGDSRTAKTGSALSNGHQTWQQRAAQTNARGYVFFYQGATYITNVRFSDTGSITVRSNTTDEDTGFTYNSNTWYSMDFETRTSDGKVRVSINGGTNWSAWYTPFGSITTGIDTVKISAEDVGTFYWDNFSQSQGGGTTPTPSAVNYSLVLAIGSMSIFIIVLFDLLRRHFI